MLSIKRSAQLVFLLMLLVMASAVAAQEVTYKVQGGDTLAQIADFYGVSQEAILVRNNLIDPNRLRSGMTLFIPTGPIAMPTTHTVQPGERLNDIAIRYNTTVEALQQANNIANPNLVTTGTVIKLPAVGGPLPATTNPGQGGALPLPTVIPGPANYERLHIVDIGQDLRYISALYGVTWQAIATRNSLTNPNYILAGTQLIIPTPTYGTGGPIVTTPVPSPSQPTTPVIVPRRTINGVYTVQAGDNMFAIATDFNVNIYTIAQANGLLNLNALYTGQALLIPGATK